MHPQPQTLQEFISELRAALVCDRCGRYVGSLAPKRYLPPLYPVALDRIGEDDEVRALVGFEWHMLHRMRQGNFVIRHPERDGHCISYREWVASDDEEGEDEEGG
ncbi:MAG: hypothetical protein ACYC9X_14345 [Dehalococcoidia bacterium]